MSVCVYQCIIKVRLMYNNGKVRMASTWWYNNISKQKSTAFEDHVLYMYMSVFSPEFSQGVGVVVLREEFLTTSKLLRSTYLQIKGDCLLKALKFKHLKYTEEDTVYMYTHMTQNMRKIRKLIFHNQSVPVPAPAHLHVYTWPKSRASCEPEL